MDTKITRRRFLQVSALTAGATMLPMPLRWLGAKEAQAAFANSQQLSKWTATQPLRGLNVPATHPLAAFIPSDPNGIPVMAGTPDPAFANTRLYEVAANQFTDTLHPAMGGVTKLWGYNEVGGPAQKHLGGLIIATRGEATRIRMANNLPPQHIIPVDPTLPGANIHNKIAIHLHGGEIPWISDGGPFDWWTPLGATGFSFLNGSGSLFDNIAAKPMAANQADYYYPNDQSTRLMWYHDHAHGITRINAYAGLATGYLCVDLAQESVVSAGTLAANFAGDNVPFIGAAVPIVFQDKVFVSPTTAAADPLWAAAAPASTAIGSLWYDHIYDPRAFKLLQGRGILPPPTPVSCVPEFFGDTMLANGTVYPVATVEAKPTRFLFLNACNARFLNMNLYQVPAGSEIWTNPKTGLPGGTIPSTGAAAVPVPGVLPVGPAMWQIGTEAGYLAAPALFQTGPLTLFNPITLGGNLILGCAERADVVIDFTGRVGQEFIIYNDAPGPFPAGPPTTDYYWGNPKNPMAGPPGAGPDTRQILRIKVVAAIGIPANAPNPAMLTGVGPENLLVPYPNPLPAVIPPLAPPAGAVVKNFTLNEDFDPYGRLRQLVGNLTPVIPGINKKPGAFGVEYLIAPQPEDLHVGNGVEIWNVYNLTADTHPMHIHLSSAQILSRQLFTVVNGIPVANPATARGPERNELGWKETFKMNPGEVTTICMRWPMPAVPFTVPSSPRATATLNIATGSGMGLPAGQIYNEYVWHCHILEHEEHDMMRPLIVTGQNPQRPNIVPTAGAIVTPTYNSVLLQLAPPAVTLSFAVTVPVGTTYSVASSNPLGYPATQTATGFDVTVQPVDIGLNPLPTPATVTFTVTDNTTPVPHKASVTVAIS